MLSIAFCNFSKAFVSICLILSLLILYFLLRSSRVGISSDNLRAINILNQREKEILIARRLSEDIATLADLSKKYNISRERIRQIEMKAFEKLQKAMLNAAGSNNLLPKN